MFQYRRNCMESFDVFRGTGWHPDRHNFDASTTNTVRPNGLANGSTKALKQFQTVSPTIDADKTFQRPEELFGEPEKISLNLAASGEAVITSSCTIFHAGGGALSLANRGVPCRATKEAIEARRPKPLIVRHLGFARISGEGQPLAWPSQHPHPTRLARRRKL